MTIARPAWWRLFAERRHRRAWTFGVAVVAMLGSATAAAPQGSLAVESFDKAEQEFVHVLNTYNVFISVHVIGAAPLQVVATRARGVAPGLVVDREPLIGWKCGFAPAFIVPGDDLRHAPGYRAWLASERALRAADEPCTYLYARVVPTRKGVIRISGFDIDYRVGSRIRTVRLDYEVVLHVTQEGVDD